MVQTISQAIANSELITQRLCDNFGFTSNMKHSTQRGLWGTSIKKNGKSWLIFFYSIPKKIKHCEIEGYNEEDKEEVFSFLDEETSYLDWSLKKPGQ